MRRSVSLWSTLPVARRMLRATLVRHNRCFSFTTSGMVKMVMDPREHELLIVDGACGTNLQDFDVPASAWMGREGCNELLNVTAPDIVIELHRGFVDAGAMVLETNTFGAAGVVLAEYGLEGRVDEINSSAVANARAAISAAERDCYVAGSIGPTTKLVSLGHISPEELSVSYSEQVGALLRAGVDMLMVETCQDMLQVKIAMVACFEGMAALGREVPLMLSITVENTGTMLVGSDVAAAVATIEPFPVFSLGLNCATGPEEMEEHLRYLDQEWPRRISCMPNQGLPEVVDGRTCYRLGPDEYARKMRHIVEDHGVTIVGGCCGTTPEHTARLVRELDGVTPKQRSVR